MKNDGLPMDAPKQRVIYLPRLSMPGGGSFEGGGRSFGSGP